MSDYPVSVSVDNMLTLRLVNQKIIPADLRTYFSDMFITLYEKYSDMRYHIIPMELANIEQVNMQNLFNAYYCSLITKFRLTQMKLEDGTPLFNNLNSYGETDVVNDGEDSGSNSNTKTYGKILTKTDEKNEFGMSENSPINASIDEIKSPSFKSAFKTDNTFTDKHTGTDEEEGEFKNTSNSTNNSKQKTVENYEKYIEFIERYNLPKLIDDTIRMYIWEFNSVR